MARIKIQDLPENQKLTRDELQEVMGGTTFSTSFENFDQKTNQLFSILSTVLKSQKEMESAVTRNLL